MTGTHKHSPRRWRAFEMSVLLRYTFASAAMPLVGDPGLGLQLKRRGVRVAANDPLLSTWARSAARIQNDAERLTADDVNIILEDAYVPGYRLQNSALASWFSETDSWWFDNVRRNIDRLSTPAKRALAFGLVIAAGDHVLSFDDHTRYLRQPLSNVFRRLWSIEPEPVPGASDSVSTNRMPEDFVTDRATLERYNDLMFLVLPQPYSKGLRQQLGRTAWREEWMRGGDSFWSTLESDRAGRLGSATGTKSQYLRLVERLLERSTHFKLWAVAHVEDGSISSQDLVELMGTFRRVETVYTKDFSELTGTKAVIITA